MLLGNWLSWRTNAKPVISMWNVTFDKCREIKPVRSVQRGDQQVTGFQINRCTPIRGERSLDQIHFKERREKKEHSHSFFTSSLLSLHAVKSEVQWSLTTFYCNQSENSLFLCDIIASMPVRYGVLENLWIVNKPFVWVHFAYLATVVITR